MKYILYLWKWIQPNHLQSTLKDFENEYAKSLNLLKSSKNPVYSKTYFQLLNKVIIKKDMLLSPLVPHNPMLVDSLMTNEALTYEDSKNRLIAMPSKKELELEPKLMEELAEPEESVKKSYGSIEGRKSEGRKRRER